MHFAFLIEMDFMYKKRNKEDKKSLSRCFCAFQISMDSVKMLN